MRVVVAPDKFKGTLDAPSVADAIVQGVRAAIPHASFSIRPTADGGEGTLEALLTARGGRVLQADATDAIGRAIRGSVGLLDDGRAVIESASASGLWAIQPEHLRALDASSRGTGELMLAAVRGGARALMVGLGGSASTDGGTGAAAVFGWRFLDARGQPLAPGGGALRALHRIDAAHTVGELDDLEVVAACDVLNPLCGDQGAARVFAPQKGASHEEVEILEQGLQTLSLRIREDLGVEVSRLPGAGAAGGLGAGLAAFFGASLVPGFELVAQASELEQAIASAELVVTGEGRLDEQSLAGKAPIGVARIAAKHGVRCVAVAGELRIDPARLRSVGIDAAIAVSDAVGARRAFEDPKSSISIATKSLIRAITEDRPRRRRFLF